MLLYEGLAWVLSQKKPRLHFGEIFALTYIFFYDVSFSLALNIEKELNNVIINQMGLLPP